MAKARTTGRNRFIFRMDEFRTTNAS
jgi:hypothetical protein